MPVHASVYRLASDFKHLYIGVTSRLEYRIAQHKARAHPHSFTARYNMRQLVYVERFADIRLAISREKQLKGWSRIKKIRLIVASNPTWQDLSKDWGQPLPPFTEPIAPHNLSSPPRQDSSTVQHSGETSFSHSPAASNTQPATTLPYPHRYPRLPKSPSHTPPLLSS